MNTSSPDGATIVIAHRDPVIRLGLAAALALSRFRDHAQVWDRSPADTARKLSAELVVTDYVHGVELCAEPGIAGRHVMVVSTRDGEQDIRTAVEVGVKGYLLHGFGLDEFIEGVATVRRGARYLCSVAANRMVDSMSRDSLTARETEVLRCLVDGHVNKQICDELGIALGTVKAHVKAIFSKLGVATRTQVVCMAKERGMVAPPSARARSAPGPAKSLSA